MRNIVYTLMFFGVLFGQTYTEGDYVNDFGANICYNGDGYPLQLGEDLVNRRLR